MKSQSKKFGKLTPAAQTDMDDPCAVTNSGISSDNKIRGAAKAEAQDAPQASKASEQNQGQTRQSGTAQIARQSVVWNVAFNFFRDVAQFAQAVILARLILPDAYGQFAIVSSMIGFLSIFTLKNFSTYTLQVKDEADTHFQDHFTSGVFFQIGAFIMCNLIAVGVRYDSNYQDLSLPIHLMSIVFLLEWPTEIRLRMLERAFDWKRRRLLHGVGILVGLAVAVVMAWWGMGVYALLIPGMLVTIPFIYDLFVHANFRPTWQWSWKDYRAAFRFGTTRMVAGMATTGRQLLENAAFVSILGFTSLGLVNRAVGLSQLVCGRISGQLIGAVYPILTRLESKTGQAALAGDLMLRLVSWVAWPLACAMAALSLPAIATVYGSEWTEAANYMRWALIWTVLMALMQVAYSLLLARQQARLCLYADFAIVAGTAACLIQLLPKGINPYFAGLSCLYGLTLCALVFFLARFSAVTKRGLMEAFLPPLVCCLAAATASSAIHTTDSFQSTRFLPAAAWGITFALLYCSLLRILFAGSLKQLISYFPGSHQIAKVMFLSL